MPGRFSKLGIQQAKKLSLRLKEVKIDCIDCIYSSDLARAADTAKEIAKFHSKIPFYYVKDLRERDFGVHAGERIDEFDWNNPPLVVETRVNMRKRSKKFLS